MEFMFSGSLDPESWKKCGDRRIKREMEKGIEGFISWYKARDSIELSGIARAIRRRNWMKFCMSFKRVGRLELVNRLYKKRKRVGDEFEINWSEVVPMEFYWLLHDWRFRYDLVDKGGLLQAEIAFIEHWFPPTFNVTIIGSLK
jgi:hypothetical protein